MDEGLRQIIVADERIEFKMDINFIKNFEF